MNKEIEEKVEEIDDPDDLESENIDMGLPTGHYHRVALQGAGFSIDVSTPAGNNVSLFELQDIAVYLALFIKDEDLQHIVKQQISDIALKDKEPKEKGKTK